ncbi:MULTISPECIES: TetR/AcrR family transcriptional regulator [Bacteroides]|uniref:TetR/AcrR family transcriptional regulator n=1 Tax=Bacteroides TaxID=816 RepID=UPI001E07F05B|nr:MULTISPECIES: TetR/AcrR family transcriptional regulator [Bacteroides]HJD92377.1 TetR/AcrR family transcriptional regulator [Bacteroides coprosuis]
MRVPKTKERLMDVARLLFAKNGVENTTMNDIAKTSKKGRRTLYTYFKNKEEVYLAVVQSELDKLWEYLKAVSEKDTPPDQKILEIIYARLEGVKEVVFRNGTLKASFFRDIWKVENVRKRFDKKEINLIKKVLEDGVNQGIFDIENVEMTAALVHYCLKGIEVPFIRGQVGADIKYENRKEYIANIVFGALGKK